MIIPPNDNNKKDFKSLDHLNNTLGRVKYGHVWWLPDAIKNNATFVRIGSAIFGSRN